MLAKDPSKALVGTMSLYKKSAVSIEFQLWNYDKAGNISLPKAQKEDKYVALIKLDAMKEAIPYLIIKIQNLANKYRLILDELEEKQNLEKAREEFIEKQYEPTIFGYM